MSRSVEIPVRKTIDWLGVIFALRSQCDRQRAFFLSASWVIMGLMLGLCPRLAEYGLSPILGVLSVLLLNIILQSEITEKWSASFIRALLGGLVFYCCVFYWAPRVIATFGNISPVFSFLVTILFFLISALQFVLFVVAWRWLLRLQILNALRLTLPVSWVIVELLWPQPIPWRLGAAFVHAGHFPLMASYIGLPGLSFLSLWIASLFIGRNHFSEQRKERSVTSKHFILPPPFMGLALILLIETSGYFLVRSLQTEIVTAPHIAVGVVQGNLDPIRDFRAENMVANLRRYQSLTAQLLSGPQVPQVIVWPESSVGINYKDGIKEIVRGSPDDPAPGLNVPLIFGGQTMLSNAEQERSKKRDGVYHSSIHIVYPDGRFVQAYHKQYLLPLSEKSFLGSEYFFPSPLEIRPASDQGLLSLKLHKGQFSPGHIAIAAVICFEDMFPHAFAQLQQSENADFLMVLSNDNWFLDSRASVEHAWMSQWRSIETGKYFLRVTNNGMTVLYSPLGEVVSQLEPHKPLAAVIDVALLRESTVYTRMGDWPIILVCLLCAGLRIIGFSLIARPGS